ncbi:hypothetical protein CICLE_v10033915mg [Citrus x clementina]|uniref:Uncharacterized protein n=1 Tax=Citrus clementina TaxID=85681 RepID=V4SWI5_CITCL|nr:hypothetical protein CICLE_v10033915mg [Citrus x clementina]
MKCSRYVVSACQLYTKEMDEARVVQNNRITLMAKTLQISSAIDNNPFFSNMTFYSVIREIWELDYRQFRILVFKYAWVKSNNGIKIDEYEFTLVIVVQNFNILTSAGYGLIGVGMLNHRA